MPTPVKKKPWQHQQEALQAMNKCLLKDKSTDSGLVILPTGAGKTFTASRWNSETYTHLGLKTIWVAHRDELIKQAMAAHAEANPGMKQTQWISNKKDASGDIIFTSIQSTRGLAETIEALYGPDSKKFQLAIDEAHHFAAPDASTGYKNMYADLYLGLRNSGSIVYCYGLTATAERLDGRPLGFKKIMYQMKFTDGVQAGFLAAPRLYEMRTQQQFHLDTMKKKNGKSDYTDADLRQLDNTKRNRQIAEEYVKHKEWRCDDTGTPIRDASGKKVHGWGKTLIFAVNVNHCYNLAEQLKEADPDLDVRVVTGGTNDSERKEFKEWLAEGDMHVPKVAINCLVFTEGFDEPTINSVFLTRPTKSEALWMQMVGRGARIITDPLTGAVLKNRFNLVSVMDEIGRYGALVKDWTMSLMDGNHQRVIKKKRNRRTRIRAKRKLFERINDYAGTDTADLSAAELVDVQAVLIFSTQNAEAEGVPLDRDRFDCLRLLKDYLQNSFVEETDKSGNLTAQLDVDAFRSSYTHCVPANEFDHDTWRRISFAYVLNYVRGVKVTRNRSGKNQPTWKVIPMVAMDELDGDKAVADAEERIDTVKENAAAKNEEFNLKYNNRRGTKKLYERIMDTLAANKMPEQALFVTKYVARIVCRDRRLEIKLKCSITSAKDQKTIVTLNKKGTEALQDFLQDSAAEFRVVGAA